MNYDVPCECGRSVSVSGADAGTQRACECGRMVEVPSLRQLRLMAGQAPTETPELVLTGMLNAGLLPEGDCCAVCGTPTDRSVLVRLDCERTEQRGGSWKDNSNVLLTFLLFGGLLTWLIYRRKGTFIERGQDVWFDVPIRACRECSRKLKGRRLKTALQTVPVCRSLYIKYPKSRATVISGNAEAG